MIFGALGDKALRDMANIIQTRTGHVYATTSDHPRARPPHQVADAFADSAWSGELQVHLDPQDALSAAGQRAHSGDLILVLGSLSLAADTRRFLSAPTQAQMAPRAEDPTV